MKKLFVSALAIASLVACSMDETVGTQADPAIAFDGVFVENATRANDPSTTNGNISEFYVWSVMDNQNGIVFDDEKVWKSGEKWAYAETQYWTPGHTYYFSAIAGDRSQNQIVLDLAAAAGMSLEGLGTATFTNLAGTNDFLYAESEPRTTGNTLTSAPEAVKLQFAHLLSKVKFTFVNGFANSNNTIVVKNVKMVAPSVATIDLTADNLAWANHEGTVTLEMGHLSEAAKVKIGKSASSDNERLTIPAPATQEYTVTFDVELWMGEVLATESSKTVKINGCELLPGHAYNFTATINHENVDENPLFPIEFEVEVNEWIEAEFDYGTLAENNAVVTNEAELKAALDTNKSVNVFFANDITASEVIYVNELANLTTTINGNGHKFVGAFRLNGTSGYHNATTVFNNIAFETADASLLYDAGFIYCGGGNGDTNRYPDNVTIKNCSFTATGAAVDAAVAAKFWSLNGNLVVEGCTAEGLHSLLQLTSCGLTNATIDGVTVANCKNGISLGDAGKVVIKNSNISTREYGVRANGCKANTTIEASTIEANQPVIVRNVTVDGYVLNVDDATVLTPGGHYDVIFTAKSDDKPYVAPSKSFTCNAPETLMVYPLVVVTETAEELAACLKADSKAINVVLANDIDLPISSLGQITGGSGEYKLGGENTETITIDLNGKLLNVTTTYWSNLGAKNDNALFTIKNGKMTSSQPTGTWNSYDLSFSNCNYAFEDVVFEKAIALSAANKAYNLKNVTINETHDYYAMWVQAVGSTVTIDGLTVNSAGRGIKIDEQYVSAPAKVTMNIANATFTTAKKAAILVKSVAGAEINAENLNIAAVAADDDFAVWVDEDAAAYADQVVVNGALVKVENSATTAVASQDELNAALVAGARIYVKDGNYTMAKCPAGMTIIGAGENVVLDVQDKKFGVHGDVAIENAKLVFSNANYTGFQHTNVESYKNCTIVGQPFLYGNKVTFEGCTFEQTSADAYNVWTYGAADVEFVNCEFNSAGKSVLIYHESLDTQNVKFEGCTLNASAPVAGKAAIEIDSSLIKGAYNVDINGTAANGFAEGNVSGNTLWNNKKGTKANITVDGVVVL